MLLVQGQVRWGQLHRHVPAKGPVPGQVVPGEARDGELRCARGSSDRREGPQRPRVQEARVLRGRQRRRGAHIYSHFIHSAY